VSFREFAMIADSDYDRTHRGFRGKHLLLGVSSNFTVLSLIVHQTVHQRNQPKGNSPMARVRTGSIEWRNGVPYARVTFKDATGKRKQIKRAARNKSEAKQKVIELLRMIDDGLERVLASHQMTFADLVAFHLTNYVQPPKYSPNMETKLSGMRSHDSMRYLVQASADFFRKRLLRSITYTDLELFKSQRLDTPTQYKRPRAVASVNRELSTLRRMLNVAKRNKWILTNPFNDGEPLILQSQETRRERILTEDEERKMLDLCTGRRTHLRPILLTALDTGMRRGEILKLTWKEVSLEERLIYVRAFNNKLMKARWLAMTSRLEEALKILFDHSPKDPDGLVFGIKSNVRSSFRWIKRELKLLDTRFHDLRHTTATTLIREHVPLQEVARILGHTQVQTTFRYVNSDIETARRAAEALNNAKKSNPLASPNDFQRGNGHTSS